MKRTIWLYAFLLFLSQTASAKIIQIHFSGDVTSANGSSIYSPGMPVEGIFTIEDGTPNSSSYPDHSEYRMMSPLSAQRGFTSLKVGNEIFSPNLEGSDATVFVANNIASGPGFTIDDVSLDSCCQVGSFSNGDFVENMHIIFNDDSNNPLNSNDLQDALVNLSVFKNKNMGINARSQYGEYYYLQVNISSITVDGASSSLPGPKNLVAFDSVVTDITDSTGQANSLINHGDSISGNFTFSPDLLDVISFAPDNSVYESPGNDENNISINIAGETITSNINSDFKVEIRNYPPEVAGPDTYFVSATSINPIPLQNGATIERTRIVFINFPAQNLSNTELLASTPSKLSEWYVANLIIEGRNPDGSFFKIRSALSDLLQGAANVIPMEMEQLFPASGVTQMGQHFDALAILNEARAPITNIYSHLHNSRGQNQAHCGYDRYTLTNQLRVICHGISNELVPGNNVMRVAIHFADGSKKYYLNRWNVVE